MQVWLQSADLSSQDHELDCEATVELFKRHNWRGESTRQAELDLKGQDNCPAGLGIVNGSNILHICPDGVSSVVHFHYKSPLFGFLWKTGQTATQHDVPESEALRMIRAFFESRWETLR